MWFRGFLLVPVLALSAGARVALSADDHPPPPAKQEDRGGQPGQRGAPGAHLGFPGGKTEDGMDQLSEDERHRLRAAVEKVWANPEVTAARERIMKANEEFRGTLREALQKSDPEVVKILEKVKTPMPWEQRRGPPPMPRADDPNFPRMAAARLGFEMMSFLRPEQRQSFRHLHERVIELPAVKEAISKVQTATPEGRPEAFKNLHQVYRKECEREVAEFRRKRAGEAGRDGNLAAPPRSSP